MCLVAAADAVSLVELHKVSSRFLYDLGEYLVLLLVEDVHTVRDRA
jgi:hypothetical protein